MNRLFYKPFHHHQLCIAQLLTKTIFVSVNSISSRDVAFQGHHIFLLKKTNNCVKWNVIRCEGLNNRTCINHNGILKIRVVQRSSNLLRKWLHLDWNKKLKMTSLNRSNPKADCCFLKQPQFAIFCSSLWEYRYLNLSIAVSFVLDGHFSRAYLSMLLLFILTN